ncbi:hypothetical protein JCM10207_006014 [Rhodosporidiobolus poonsookiae]
MPLQDDDWSAFLTDEALDGPHPGTVADLQPSLSPSAHHRQPSTSHLSSTSAATPGASTSSGDSPGVSDSFSSQRGTDTAVTSLAASPSSHSGAFPPFPHFNNPMDPNGKLPDGLEQLAASWQAHQQAIAFHTQAAVARGEVSSPPPSGASTPAPQQLPMGVSFPTGLPPVFAAGNGAQLQAEWIAAANVAQPFASAAPPTSPFPGYPSFPTSFPPPTSSAASTVPLSPYATLGQFPPGALVDPNLYALQVSLEAQARMAAAVQAGVLPGFDSPSASTPVASPAAGPNGPASHGRSSTAPTTKRSSSYLKAAHGLAAAAHQRSRTQPGQSSPLASPAILPPDASSSYGFPAVSSPTTTTYQRPLPPLPPSRSGQTSVGSAGPSSLTGSPVVSQAPLATSYAMPAPYSAAPYSAAYPLPSATAPAYSSHSVVDYDFSSLEQDLDRFSSLGGFASAAAAAMASVGPSSASHAASGSSGNAAHKPADAYNVGGYGGSSTPRLVPDVLPSPKVLTDVLNDPIFFPLPASTSTSQKGSSPAASAASAGTSSAKAARTPSANGASPLAVADEPSPAGSTIIDEEGAELLSRKDPIAAQVWRMFHKAKNTQANGARMENLTWRLMSMTLRKRREDSAFAAGGVSAASSVHVSGNASQAPSPGTDEARTRRALEAALEETEAQEEGRDTVQPLKGAPGRMRRDRSDSSAKSRPGAVVQPEEDEEERGRGRRAKNGTASKSNSATPEPADEGEMMDWRAMSKSRSRSRAPDTMDWRAASRSRSRAPDFRVSVAPPAVDSTNALANFSRFFNDSGMPSVTEMPPLPPPAPVASAPPPAPTPLSIPTSVEDNSAALAELATSLGLSPQDQVQLFGSATARLDGHSLLDLPSPAGMGSPPPPSLGALASPLNNLSPGLSTSPQPFHFPNAASPSAEGPDPNLAAIENTLNQLISLQNLASPSGSAASSPVPLSGQTPAADSSLFSSSVKSPLSTSYTVSHASDSTEPTPQPSTAHSRESSLNASLSSSFKSPSAAQQHLQQVISGRKNSANLGASTSSSSSARRISGSSSSPYLTATTLAQSAPRPYSFGAAASVAAAAASSAVPASGLSLARPSQLPAESSHPPTPYSEPSTPSFFPSSAPAQPAVFGSPNPPLFGEGTDTANLLYDYFHSQHNAAPFLPSPYVSSSQLETFGSAPTSLDPSQLFSGNFGASTSTAPSPYASDASSWGVSPRSTVDSPAGVFGSPPNESALSSSAKGKRPAVARANSAGSVLTGAGATKSKSAPGSRVHSRSNTISLPSTIEEGKPLEIQVDDGTPEDVSSLPKTSKPPPGGRKDPDGSPTKCLNCQTTNTPLWRRDAEGRPLCNACGLFRNLHGVDRPANLNTGVIKKRNRTRGPKDPNAKKSTAASRAAARRNSASSAAGGSGASPPPPNSRKERAGGSAPYPNAAARAAADKQLD